MKISLIICAILGLFHLAMVSLGAAQLDFRTWKWADLGIAYYGAFSGADTGYSFFVPGAGPQFRAYFEIVEAEKTFSDSLEKGKSQEVTTKIENLVVLLWESFDRPELQRSISASLVGKMYSRHPEAKKITVVYQIYNPPSSVEYRKGVRPTWQTIYKAAFVKKNSSQA